MALQRAKRDGVNGAGAERISVIHAFWAYTSDQNPCDDDGESVGIVGNIQSECGFFLNPTLWGIISQTPIQARHWNTATKHPKSAMNGKYVSTSMHFMEFSTAHHSPPPPSKSSRAPTSKDWIWFRAVRGLFMVVLCVNSS